MQQGRARRSATTALVVDDLRGDRRHRAASSSTTSASRCAPARSLAVAGVQGNGQTELTEAHRRPAGPRVAGSIRLDGERARRPVGARRSSTPGSASSPRTARRRPRRRVHASPRTSCSTAAVGLAVRQGRRPAHRLRSRDFAEQKIDGVRHPRARHRHAGRAASPAATSRRSSLARELSAATSSCSSPPSPPAASTSARSSSSTSGSSRRATPASPCSWCRPSSTRWSRSPTGSW